MILKLFTQPNCPKCPAAHELVGQLKANWDKNLQIEEYDVATTKGLAEASFYSVMATPNLILCDNNGQEVWAWRDEVPPLKEILEKFK